MSLFKTNIQFRNEDGIGDPFDFLNNDPNFEIRRGTIEDFWMGGNFRSLSRQSILRFNGSTYSLWYKEKVDFNQVGILKQTGDFVESVIVNDGTVGQEPINHPAPMLYIDEDTGIIYVFQNRFHVDSIRVWKSNSPENIENGFSYVGEFGTDTAYLALLEGNGKDAVIQTRAGATNNDIYSMSVVKLNLDTLVNEQIQITNSQWQTNDWRHYLLGVYQYGTSDKVVIGIAHRNQPPTGTGYYKFSLLYTDRGGDYKTYTNRDGTFSKNIETSGFITNTELETHFAEIGSDTARTTIISEGNSIRKDNTTYICWMSDDANSRFSIRTLADGVSTSTDFLIPLTTIAESDIWYTPIYMYDNGSNWVFSIYENTPEDGFVTNIYKSNYDFSGFQKVYIETLDKIGYHYGIPLNLDEVTGKYLIMGRDDNADGGQSVPFIAGEFIYTITQNKFLM